jgi:hypothetical protein
MAVPVHASLTEEHLVGLNSDQGSMVMGISEYLKGAVNLLSSSRRRWNR